jgi:hypothetical protein
MEFGDSGAQLVWGGPQNVAMMRIVGDSELKIETVRGQVKVSTQIRDTNGNPVAGLRRNEWQVSPHSWDRNYTKDAAEVIDSTGKVVLQVRALPDRIQLQGEWWSTNGRGIRIVKARNPQTGIQAAHI